MTAKAGISIKEICEHYTIKQSTAYKWRSTLEKMGLKISWENLDKIESREINLTNPEESALVVSSQSAIASSEPAVEIAEIEEEITEIFGITRERVLEINQTAEIEVNLEETFKEYHRSKRQLSRAEQLKKQVEESKNIDPLELGKMLEKLTKKAAS